MLHNMCVSKLQCTIHVVFCAYICPLVVTKVLLSFLVCRIVNSELTYFMGALGSLENINAFRSSLFDVWIMDSQQIVKKFE